jgi:hypothetical protein
MIDNLENIIQQWLWEFLVDQSNFENRGKIGCSKQESPEEIKKDSDLITFSFTDFRYKTLVSNIKVREVSTDISEFQSCILSIFYQGKKAYQKLNKIAGRIRSSDAASEFLEQHFINPAILNVLDISRLVGDNNIQESANLDVVLTFGTSVTEVTPTDGYIEGGDFDEIQLFE